MISDIVINDQVITCLLVKLFDDEGDETIHIAEAVTAVAQILEGAEVNKYVVVDIESYSRIVFH